MRALLVLGVLVQNAVAEPFAGSAGALADPHDPVAPVAPGGAGSAADSLAHELTAALLDPPAVRPARSARGDLVTTMFGTSRRPSLGRTAAALAQADAYVSTVPAVLMNEAPANRSALVPGFGGAGRVVAGVDRPAWHPDMRAYAQGGMVITPPDTGDRMLLGADGGLAGLGSVAVQQFWSALSTTHSFFWGIVNASAVDT